MGWKARVSKKLNSKGFGLVEIMISMGVLSIMTLATMSVISISNGAMRNVTLSGEINDFLFVARTILNSNDGCLANFSTLTYSGSEKLISDLYFPKPGGIKGVLYAKVGNLLGGLKISDMRIVPVATYGPQTYLANMAITFEKTGSILGPNVVQRTVAIELQTDASNNITACDAVSHAIIAPKNIKCPGAMDFLQGFDSMGLPICSEPTGGGSGSGSGSGSGGRSTASTSPPSRASCEDSACAGTNAVVFPVSNSTTHSCNGMPAICTGAWSVDTTGGNYKSTCSTGWVMQANCEGFDNCPMGPGTENPCP